MKPALVVSLLLLVPSLALAQPADASRLFSHQASVTQQSAQSYRLPLGPDVLAICRADLSDVRLYDASGTEVPWLLDSATRVAMGAEQLAESSAPILATPTHTIEHSPTIPFDYHEVYEIPGPGEPPSRSAWTLVVGTRRDRFVADVRVTAWDVELAHGNVYRFLDPVRELARLPLDHPVADRVRVELHGHEGYLEPSFTWVATRRARVGEELVVPLEIVSQTHDAGQTVLTLARPVGVLPEALRFTTTTPAFLRAVHVDGGGRTSDDRVWRVPGDLGVASLDVRAPATRDGAIVVRIDDQDSPPLAGLAVAAVLSRPVLVYFTPASMLRFGGGRVRAPHYDLSALQGSWAVDQLLDGSDTPSDATLGPIEASPGWTGEPALAFLHRAGVVVPEGTYTSVAPLEVAHAGEGASRFVLDAAVLAAARTDLADLRVVDANGAQWPYLVRDTDPLRLAVTLGAPVRETVETRYEVPLPAARLAVGELDVDPDAPIVARSVRVLGIDPRGDEIQIGAGQLARYATGDPGALSVPLSYGDRVSAMWLAVTDGSETPLAFRTSTLVVPTPEIVLVAPPGSYRVLVGDETAQAPTYEIESIRGLLDAIPLDDATLGPVAANPAHHEPTFWDRNDTSTLALWALLVVAILVLGALTWRASRSPEAPATPRAPPPDAPAA